jgi:hypothetical protein
MGDKVSDSATRDVIAQINARFEEGDAIAEMVALHRQFRIFGISKERSLYDSWLLLGIKASDRPERARWRTWTEETLRGYASDMDGVDGHDRLVRAFQENLESDKPLPMYYKHHRYSENPKVTVSRGMGPAFSSAEHVVMSIPITPTRR